MFSPKIVPYQPNAAVQSQRIDPKDWEKLRPRLEELYIKDDKKLDEVMQIMALNEYFHASRRQYTQKFNEWGLCKKFPGQVMRSALRKRARAGNDDLPIKYRGTAIGKENLHRWQQRVPSFNPMSSPTASTPSQLNVETPQAATPESQGDALQSLGWRSPSISISNDDGATYDDNMVQIAYNEIRRSVSPQVAEYIFQPRENRSPSKGNNLAEVRWTFDRILSISMTEHELLGLNEKDWDILAQLALNLWNFGHQRFCLTVKANPREFYFSTKNLANAYLRVNQTTECETLLMGVIAQIDLLHPGDPLGDDSRSLLGQLRLHQGQHTLAEQLCRQAMLRLISASGLAHCMTWKAYCRLQLVLNTQARFDDMWRLATDFYSDVHRTASAQVLSGLNALLELCRSYIEKWIAESKLQRLVRDYFIDDIPLGVGEKSSIILDAIARERSREEGNQGIPELVKDLQGIMGLPLSRLLSTTSLLIASRIQPGQHLEWISLRQEALRVIQDLKSAKFLFPLWILMFLYQGCFWTNNPKVMAEYNIIQSLEDVVIGRSYPTEAASFRPSADAGKSVSTLDIAESTDIRQSDLLDGSQGSMFIPMVPGQTSFAEASPRTLGLDIGIPVSSAVPLTVPCPTRPQFRSASTESRALAMLDHIEVVSSPSVLSRNAVPFAPQSLTTDPGGQLLSTGRSNNSFPPTMMNNPTSPLTLSLRRARNPSDKSPPPRPGEYCPAPAPSSVLKGRPSFTTPPNLFGLSQSPLPRSPYQAPDSPSWA